MVGMPVGTMVGVPDCTMVGCAGLYHGGYVPPTTLVWYTHHPGICTLLPPWVYRRTQHARRLQCRCISADRVHSDEALGSRRENSLGGGLSSVLKSLKCEAGREASAQSYSALPDRKE